MNAADSSVSPPEVTLILALETTACKSGPAKAVDIILAGKEPAWVVPRGHIQQKMITAMGFRAMQFNLVVSTNERAVRLWRKLGFSVVGTLPRAFRHLHLGYVDALVMFKELSK